MTSLHESGKYLVYGYSLSYFSRKLEAAMDWYGLDYEFRIKAPELKAELEKRRSLQTWLQTLPAAEGGQR